MNRIDRLHAILTHLQSKRRVTAQEIADRFNISLRTVYRDVKALDESGVPVIGEAGSGYSIMEGYRLPPVMFTQEEAAAILLGAKLAEQLTDASVKKYYDAALFKIKAVLRASDKEHVDNLSDHVAVIRRQMPDSESGDQHLAALQKNIVEKKVIHIRYYSNNDELTEREVEPIGLCYYGQNWHLIGWCRLRNDYRDFRVSRIRQLQAREEVFNTNHPPLQDYIKTMTDTSELKEVVVRFKKDVIRHLGEQKYYYGFVKQEEDNDYVQMHFLTSYLLMFGYWLLTFSNKVTIVTPPELIANMKKLSEELYRHYQ